MPPGRLTLFISIFTNILSIPLTWRPSLSVGHRTLQFMYGTPHLHCVDIVLYWPSTSTEDLTASPSSQLHLAPVTAPSTVTAFTSLKNKDSAQCCRYPLCVTRAYVIYLIPPSFGQGVYVYSQTRRIFQARRESVGPVHTLRTVLESGQLKI